ncbi:response regulator transcription factor [Sphingomonas sp. ID0503]|uniref:response regulator transcription factor n=1 Tax=Sphingomonas sp. ID0503 TaxID=3399691 RepID=UPI003AFA2C28
MSGADACLRLSERQRECLRLVYKHMRQKEIARELGIAPTTVEMHLKAARTALGAADSREAAQILALYEGRDTYGQSIHGPEQVAERLSDLSPIVPQPNYGNGRFGAVTDQALHEDQAFFDAFAETQSFLPDLPFPTQGRAKNDLGPWLRLAWIGTIVVGLLLGTAMMVGALANLTPVVDALNS